MYMIMILLTMILSTSIGRGRRKDGRLDKGRRMGLFIWPMHSNRTLSKCMPSVCTYQEGLEGPQIRGRAKCIAPFTYYYKRREEKRREEKRREEKRREEKRREEK